MAGRRGPRTRPGAARALVLCALLAFGAAGCKKGSGSLNDRPTGAGGVGQGTSPGQPTDPVTPSGGSNGQGGDPSPSGGSGSGSGSGFGGATDAFTAADLQTYGYAFTDEA